MTVYRWQPRQDVENAGKKIRQMFNEFEGVMQNGLHVELGTFSPRVDISETKDAVYLIAELPGMKPEDVKITISEGTLTLRGEKKRVTDQNGHTFHRLERSHGEFARQFTLPLGLNEDAVEANFADGVLEVVIPRREPEKPKEREVKIGVKA